MYQYQGLEDTIAAISTAAGAGGIGIVRLSGDKALTIADAIFVPKDQSNPSQFQNFTVRYGNVVDPNQDALVLDEALLTVMRAPRSYTREDIVEISCHGGSVVLKTILSLVVDLGARLAEPGEFTKRAFLNGRIDLTQAEAVLDVIQSKTEAFLRVSTHQLKGELTIELEAIREALLNIYTELEAVVNFPEDDIDAQGKQKLLEHIQASEQQVEKLLKTAEQGRILREGIKLVLCGKPNVGKSSLLNVLLKQPRAIVSEIEGTTRDTIEEAAQIRGVPLQIVDTAGILEPRDLIEEEAVRRSHLSMQGADLVLLILDVSRSLSQEDELIIEKIKNQNVLVVLNKCDLDQAFDVKAVESILPGKQKVLISAVKQVDIDKLEDLILDLVVHDHHIDTQAPMVTNIRHIQALKQCQELIQKAEDLFGQGASFEFISEEIKVAVNRLDSITGRNIDDDLMDKIFSEFCIGK